MTDDSTEADLPRIRELARQLFTAASDDDLSHQASEEILGGEIFGEVAKSGSVDDLIEATRRLALLMGALGRIGLKAAWMAALARRDERDEHGRPVELQAVLQELMLLSEPDRMP